MQIKNAESRIKTGMVVVNAGPNFVPPLFIDDIIYLFEKQGVLLKFSGKTDNYI